MYTVTCIDKMSSVLFQAPSSFFDPSFWEELYKRKLHIYKLQSSNQSIQSSSKSSNGKMNESFEFSNESFKEDFVATSFRGNLKNVNTVEVRLYR